MPEPISHRDQRFPSLLDATSADVRSVMDAAEIAQAWAARLLETGDYTKRQRQQLWDIRRAFRVPAINRCAFAVLFDLSPLAPLDAATWGPSRIEIAIAARGAFALPSEEDAHTEEERANHEGNLAQHRRKERRTLSTALDIADTMSAQVLASKQLAMAAVRR